MTITFKRFKIAYFFIPFSEREGNLQSFKGKFSFIQVFSTKLQLFQFRLFVRNIFENENLLVN